MLAAEAPPGTARARPSGLFTVADLLDLPEVRAGDPELVAGAGALDLPVRWVHISEVPDVAALLRGGEVLLTTGIALPDDGPALSTYVHELASVGVSALAIELGRRFRHLPVELVEAANRLGLPVVVFRREVPFVDITRAVHSKILHHQLERFRAEERVRHAFHAVGAGASADDVVRKMSELAHCPVIFESPAHRPLAVSPASVPVEELLAGWEVRSRRVGNAPRGWLTACVELRSQPWGRVIMLVEGPELVEHRTVLETGASMLAIACLVAGSASSLEHEVRRQLLEDVAGGDCASIGEFYVRSASLGVQLRARSLAAIAVRSNRPRCASAVVSGALDRHSVPHLTARLRDDLVCALVGLPSDDGSRAHLESIAHEVRRGFTGDVDALAVGAAFVPGGAELDELAAAMLDADEAARSALGSAVPGVVTVEDIGLEGLLRLLAEDPRVQRFVTSRLGRVWDHDDRHHGQLFRVLETYLGCGGNKSIAATRLHSSRTAVYHALERLGDLVGMDLDDADVRTALHVAVLASRAGAAPRPSPS